jgi:hypothetical protein
MALHGVKQTLVDVMASCSSRFAELALRPTIERKTVSDGILSYEREN